jgi:hypothetical protein
MAEFGTSGARGVTQEQLKTGAGYSLQSPVIDLTATAGTATLIGTPSNDAASRFAIMHRRVKALSIDNVSVSPVISIGTNAPDYNNIVASWDLTSLDVVQEYLQTTASNIVAIPSGTAIYAAIVTPATADAMTAIVTVEGSHDQPLT